MFEAVVISMATNQAEEAAYAAAGQVDEDEPGGDDGET